MKIKIKRSVTTKEEIDVELELPFYGVEGNNYLMIAGDKNEHGDLLGMKIWNGADNLVSIQDVINYTDPNAFTPIAAEEFWEAYHEAKDRLSKKEFLCKSAAIDAGVKQRAINTAINLPFDDDGNRVTAIDTELREEEYGLDAEEHEAIEQEKHDNFLSDNYEENGDPKENFYVPVHGLHNSCGVIPSGIMPESKL